ncbi:WW domain-containing protein C660.06-like [Cryptomeria japonica]|uniref:WW domain-containing protein C660.06-like n=1 Tax=Cryptomeria japonica TaxID=3369 RepID=UPI0027D9F1E4|nr:WW domain-containing protein C660.06-like [Cryptomeria japonica]
MASRTKVKCYVLVGLLFVWTLMDGAVAEVKDHNGGHDDHWGGWVPGPWGRGGGGGGPGGWGGAPHHAPWRGGPGGWGRDPHHGPWHGGSGGHGGPSGAPGPWQGSPGGRGGAPSPWQGGPVGRGGGSGGWVGAPHYDHAKGL